jgi:hypothetical protein
MNVYEYLDTLIVTPKLLLATLITTFLAGMALQAMIRSIRDSIRLRRWDRQEAKDEVDATRIMAGIRPEQYQSPVDNGEYFEAVTDGKGYRLKEGWRNLVEESRPRSPEIVAEEVYRIQVRHAIPVQLEPIDTTDRRWLEWVQAHQWTEQELQTPGRHRAREEDWKTRALNTSTGSFTTLDRRELTRV